jgi:hypothetical protein
VVAHLNSKIRKMKFFKEHIQPEMKIFLKGSVKVELNISNNDWNDFNNDTSWKDTWLVREKTGASRPPLTLLSSDPRD